MEIIDCSGSMQESCILPVEVYRTDGGAEQVEAGVLRSQDVNVFVNGKPRMTLSCTPVHVVEAVMGRMFLEGDIPHVMGAVMANIGIAGRVVYVQISRSILAQDGWSQIASKLERALQDKDEPGQSTLSPLPWNPDHLMTLAEALANTLEGPASLRGVHSCEIGAKDDILYQECDRDPESALDKAFGAAFLDGAAVAGCTVVSNAPMGPAFFARLLYARIATVVALTCPTEQDVMLAKLCGITLADVPEPGCIRMLHDSCRV